MQTQTKEDKFETQMALVIPMESFRDTVQRIFQHVKWLRAVGDRLIINSS